MKNVNRRLIGVLLVIAVLVLGGAIQWFGPGLMTTDYPVTPPAAAAQGITLMARTSYHIALIPLVILGIAGAVLSLTPKRAEASPVLRH